MCRKATKGNVKQKRWKKGQSSSSNPDTKKFREEAKRCKFSYKPGEGTLTQSALAQHDALQSQGSQHGSLPDDNETQSIGGKTYDTFASNWSECSNPSFNRLMRYWNSSSSLHKEMLAVLAAVTEVIKSKGGKETETEYFAALITTLNAVDTDESVTAVVSLLSMVLKSVPPSVLKLKFSETAKLFVTLLGKYVDSDYVALLRQLLRCLSILLRAQELAVWGNSSTLQIYDAILIFVVHTKPKVRKAAQHAVCAILRGSAVMTGMNPPACHPVATTTAKFCVQKIEECGGSGTPVLHVLGLLKELLGVFPQKSLKATCETILQVMTLNSVDVISCSFQALHGMFASKPKPENLPAELNAQIITALYDYQPSINDARPLIGWLMTIKEAILNLQRLNQQLCISHLPRLFSVVTLCWLSDKPEIVPVVGDTLKAVLLTCVNPSSKEFQTASDTTTTSVHKIVQHLEGALKYQFHAAWQYVLEVLAVMFKVLGKEYHTIMKQCLQSLADLRDSYEFAYTAQLDKTFGSAVKAMGPAVVLDAVPLQINGESDNLDFPRSWLLPVLRDNIQETELAYFTKYFLPLAVKLRKKILEYEKEGRIIEAKTYNALQSQIWSLLHGFCNNPTDLVESFKGIAKILGTALNEQPDLRLNVMTSIKLLINKNLNNATNRAELSKFAKNYLPILFNMYTTEPKDSTEMAARLASYDTIKVYLQISGEMLCGQLFMKALDNLKVSEITAFNRHALIDLNRALLPYLDEEKVKSFYNYCKPLIQLQDRTVQKKAYLVMEELCMCKSEGCHSFVENNISELQDILLASLSTSSPSSKGPRLRCLTYILSHLTKSNKQFVIAAIPEAILCTKENAEKPRIAAYHFLTEAGKTFKKWQPDNPKDALQEYIHLLMAGLAGSPHMISATVLSIANVIYEFRDVLPTQLIHQMIENVCILLTAPAREIVQAALSFIKTVFFTSRPEDVVQFVEILVKNLVNIAEDNKRNFRSQCKEIFCRLIRKFGYEMISKLVPQNYQKILKNICKIETRKAKQKLSRQIKCDKEDELAVESKPQTIESLLKESDDELETEMGASNQMKNRPMKKAVRRRGHGVAWIKEHASEEVVDFLDVSVNKKVMATKPVEESRPKVKHDFKQTTDGRLIITEPETDAKSNKFPSDRTSDAFQAAAASRKGQKRKLEIDSDDDGNEGIPAKYQAGGKGIHRNVAVPMKKDSPDYGKLYKSKKAGGDSKIKGKPDPYAYIPLDRKTLNKRKRAKLAGRFKNLIRAGGKGAKKGKANFRTMKGKK